MFLSVLKSVLKDEVTTNFTIEKLLYFFFFRLRSHVRGVAGVDSCFASPRPILRLFSPSYYL